MMRKTLSDFLVAICRSATAHPAAWLIVTLLISLPAVSAVRSLSLDTNLIRLLPNRSKAAQATRELDRVTGGGGSFTVLFEGEDQQLLSEVVDSTAERIRMLDNVRAVEYLNPTGFIEQYRYLLIPTYYLDLILDLVLDLQAETSPFLLNLDDDESAEKVEGESYGEREDQKEIERQLDHYGNLPQYQQSSDGRVVGILVRPRQGVTNLGATRALFDDLQEIADSAAEEFGLWTGVSGSLRNKIDEYDLIVADLSRSGLITATAIILTLLVSFKSIRVIPVLLYPLAVGLLWAFALVPSTVGDLNVITSFLLVVLFGMGIDYSIHLVKRFQLELSRAPLEEAMVETYRSTGTSVAISGLTTVVALGILAVSDFRGFKEFGIVGGMSIVMVLLAMFSVMPGALVLGHRWGLVKPSVGGQGRRRYVPGRRITVLSMLAVVATVAISLVALEFDYDFSKMKASLPESGAVKQRHQAVFTTSGTPAAIYVARDLEALDDALRIVEEQRLQQGSTLGRIVSIRDFAPTEEKTLGRLQRIASIREETRGSWIRRIEDAEKRRWIDDLNSWEPYSRGPDIEDIPQTILNSLVAQDGSGRWLLGVFPSVERSNGESAMAFTEELYRLDLPAGVGGPIGETPVFAEILWLVTEEGPQLVAFTLLGISLVLLLYRRSLRDAFWMLLPLVLGVGLTLGVLAAFGIKLNFFNVVVLPALLGVGVDHGVHFYRRWRELNSSTQATQDELFGPLSICTATTMTGYSGMVFAHHAGLHSIGVVACVGLSSIWFTSLVLLPGMLNWKPEKVQ